MLENDKALLKEIIKLKPVLWENSKLIKSEEALKNIDVSIEEIYEAEARLERFATLIRRFFPETEDGIIESPLMKIEGMKESSEKCYNSNINGELYLKCDSHLKVAGSVKARGGIYEVLKYAETLCLTNRMITKECDYSIMAEKSFKDFFSKYTIAVGSTGNLGLSIGIMSRALGFNTVIHMSKDAKEWKKKLLREKGAAVIEYEEDYSKAVEEGRKQCSKDPNAYFIDDENSKDLFYGYTTAALRLKKQLDEQSINVDNKHQLYVYLPCGVGGAPGGITYGLKAFFGDNVHCYFVEPTHSPCMLLGLMTEKFSKLHVRDFGIDNITDADGLAVGSPSELISNIVKELIDGEFTIEDDELYKLLALLKDSEGIKIEPSAAAGLLGPLLVKAKDTSTHIAWATGGLFLPDDIYLKFCNKGKSLLNKKS
ncbi:D-serine ammonia-lyase [Candidatus Clostridium radicumherbarum]|uniref:Probable D-serine dehydratase n=1 Tax=Candidatus Clostridium radicumherbarum TaxID=3381662 RepID=A0ABW8TS08_9CLOT